MADLISNIMSFPAGLAKPLSPQYNFIEPEFAIWYSFPMFLTRSTFIICALFPFWCYRRGSVFVCMLIPVAYYIIFVAPLILSNLFAGNCDENCNDTGGEEKLYTYMWIHTFS